MLFPMPWPDNFDRPNGPEAAKLRQQNVLVHLLSQWFQNQVSRREITCRAEDGVNIGFSSVPFGLLLLECLQELVHLPHLARREKLSRLLILRAREIEYTFSMPHPSQRDVPHAVGSGFASFETDEAGWSEPLATEVNTMNVPKAGSEDKPKKKICCACPETKVCVARASSIEPGPWTVTVSSRDGEDRRGVTPLPALLTLLDAM